MRMTSDNDTDFLQSYLRTVLWIDESNAFMDIVTDEYKTDFDGDGEVSFLDYAVLALVWKPGLANDNYNDICDFFDDDFIDYKYLGLFLEN